MKEYNHVFRYIISVDIGKKNDYTVICVFQRVNDVYHLVLIDRYRHEDYSVLISKLLRLLEHPQMKDGRIAVIADETGSGQAMIDFIRNEGIPAYGLHIHGGVKTEMDRDTISAAKNDLVFHLQNVVEKGRLKIADTIKFNADLKKEMQSFSPKINKYTGNISYEAIRAKDHDDIVMSIAMALLFGEMLYPAQLKSSESVNAWEELESRYNDPFTEFGIERMNPDTIEDVLNPDPFYPAQLPGTENIRRRIKEMGCYY